MIEVKKSTKYYNFAERPAVKNVNFLAKRERLRFFWTLNGAGKSTTIEKYCQSFKLSGGSQHLRLSESQSGGKKKFWLCAGGTDSL